MSRRILLFTQILFILFLIPVVTFAQQSAVSVRVEGVVSDSITGETVPYATIKIYDKTKPQLVDKAIPTDANGKFDFTMNKKGDYLMTVEFIGKLTVAKEFTVDSEKRINMGSVLMQDNTQLLGEVVVSSQRPLVKVDIDKITYNMEDDPESKTNNVLEMLKKVPMVTVDGEDNIELKGSSSFKIYMNGKPSNMISSNPKEILKSMPANTVKDIEVITDPGAKYDAEGVGGIINIITQKNASMVGYNARVNVSGDSRGGYNTGANLTLKVGKVGFMGNYNLYKHKQPGTDSYLYREDYTSADERYMIQNGRGDGRATGQFGSGELSFEIDTLNLINVGFNRYQGKWRHNSFAERDIQNTERASTQKYSRHTQSENTYGYTGFNVDYQKTSATVKDRLFTVSYRFGTSPNETASDNHEEPLLNYIEKWNRQYSDGKMNEHTFQLDYTTPIHKIHTLEAGLKYIIRQNESTSGYTFLEDNAWHQRVTDNDRFEHRQDIASAYLGYSVKVKKFGFKTGLRYEYTDVEGKYPLSSNDNFESDYSNLVPSAAVSYQLKPMQTLRMGYNMRIWRPGIWALNPYPDTSDSLNIRVGNPELDAVKSHAISLNYSFFNPKINFNTNLSYDFTNNNIENYTVINNGVTSTTYRNIGKNKRLNLHTYVNWTPTQKIRINANLSGNYSDLRANNEWGWKNSGFQGRMYVNLSYTLPLKFRMNGYGGYSSPYISLQGEGSSFTYHGFSLSKDFLNDKLNVRLSASNPFKANNRFKNETTNPEFYMLTESVNKMRFFGVNVSFSFGEMKSQIKKTSRGINNDDAMSGGSGNSGQGGQQMPQ